MSSPQEENDPEAGAPSPTAAKSDQKDSHEKTSESSPEETHTTHHSHHDQNEAIPEEINPRSHIQHKQYESVEHDSFFAFVPKLLGYGAKVVGHECQHVQRAICGLPRWSKEYSVETYDFYKANPRTFYSEVISGFTVAIMQVPESIAFSFVAGVPPLSGLHATFWMATITGLFGGKPGMISGAAGALAVVVADLTAEGGDLDYLTKEQRLNALYMTMIWCGVAQILFAWLRLAKVVRLIPETGMIGFMNGLAIIIFMAQLPAFQKCRQEDLLFVECALEDRQYLTFSDDTSVLILSLVHVVLCMIIMKLFPLIPKIGSWIPASLVSLLVGTFLEHVIFRSALDVDTRTVSETAKMSGSLPKFDWPNTPSDSQTLTVIIQYALTLAAIGSVESVLTLQACNEITDDVPQERDSNQELFAQGLGNLVSGLFRAMGGDAMIGQSTINIMNGARHRVSSTCSGLFMLLFVVAISPFIELLPVSTLTGVLFMVVISTFQWKTFNILRYGRLSDSAVILLVTLVAVFFNLAIAIGCGIILSALVHAWDSGTHVDADILYKPMKVNKSKGNFSSSGSDSDDDGETGDEDEDDEEDEIVDVKYVHVKGSIFFGSSRHFINMFHVINDPATVIIDLKDALIIDHSAVAAISGITHRFAKVGKRVLLVNVPHKSHGRLHRTGDHDRLKQQIVTHPTEVVDVEHGVTTAEEAKKREEQKELRRKDSGISYTQTIGSGYMNDDDGNIEVSNQVAPHSYGGWGNLSMFNYPTEGVEDELDHLVNKSGHFHVKDMKHKKDKKET